jgi:manganese/zinc/iron transport system permease protein
MLSTFYHNPYEGQNFFGFFYQLLIRLWGFLSGKLALENLASDEIQVIVLACVAASSALVGTFLVLRKMTMLANSLSHTILLGIVIAFMLTHEGPIGGDHDHAIPINIHAMLLAALIMGILTTFLTEFFTKIAGLQEDASTGLVFTSLFALGIVLVTLLTRNAHIGTEVVMGNVDALHIDDCRLVLVILGINALLFICFFKEFKITTFDPGLSRALGISSIFFNYLLMIQTSATAIGAFRAVGVLMVLAFITGPVLTARFLTDSLKPMLFYAMGIGIAASVLGVALSRHLLTVYGLALSTSGIVVCMIVLLFVLAMIYHLLQQRGGKLPVEGT